MSVEISRFVESSVSVEISAESVSEVDMMLLGRQLDWSGGLLDGDRSHYDSVATFFVKLGTKSYNVKNERNDRAAFSLSIEFDFDFASLSMFDQNIRSLIQ